MNPMPNNAAMMPMNNMMPMMNSMPMMNPMMMNPMSMMMPMNMMPGMGMQQMQMPQMPMQMPMMMAMPMMCQMSAKMTKTGMVCEITPMNGMTMEMLKECCDRMNAMMNMGAPVMMNCGNMQPMMCVPCQK